ncbi:hypothetical protein EB796_014911 [Bugula neritina]|uniref:Uncharacterized protein n=1 Tax=Bugula neritina TaxID=10212 RepID=A0A7J7JKE0_BUGNE|nr:hypothetical protein EB796_014911 [Bugula neritina]
MPTLLQRITKRAMSWLSKSLEGNVWVREENYSGYKPDWQLISKADEKKYLSNELAYEPVEAPTTADMPPLLAKFYMDRLSRDGIEVKPEDTKLYLRVNRGVHNRAQQSQVDELTESLPSEERIQHKTWAERQMLKTYKRKGVSRPSL